jgi:hypothetical protein
MNDRDLERRLRGWYGTQVGESEVAPLWLRRDIAAIPHTVRRGGPFSRGRVTFLAVAAMLVLGGTMAASIGAASDDGFATVGSQGPGAREVAANCHVTSTGTHCSLTVTSASAPRRLPVARPS